MKNFLVDFCRVESFWQEFFWVFKQNRMEFWGLHSRPLSSLGPVLDCIIAIVQLYFFFSV